MALDFTEEQISWIGQMLAQDQKLFLVKRMMEELGFSHADAKGIVMHVNREFGKCHRCNLTDLKEAYTECPKCKSFNYNFKI